MKSLRERNIVKKKRSVFLLIGKGHVLCSLCYIAQNLLKAAAGKIYRALD